MLDINKGNDRKLVKSSDRAVPPTDDAAGLLPPAAVAAARGSAGKPMPSNTREQNIAIAAYYKAQERGFQDGSTVD
ncbi:MAG TPA: DUF2934 domain-containing protein, partial [Burkholderiaceae bacterium]